MEMTWWPEIFNVEGIMAYQDSVATTKDMWTQLLIALEDLMQDQLSNFKNSLTFYNSNSCVMISGAFLWKYGTN